MYKERPKRNWNLPRIIVGDPTLLKARMREMDQEFTRQTKQLAALTKRLRARIIK